MVSQAMSREVALRIALAAKALPGVELRRLLRILSGAVAAPLTEAGLAKVTVAELDAGLGGGDGEAAGIGADALEQAVRCLRGEEAAPPVLPLVQPYAAGDMPGSIRVALASESDERLDGHFGSCPRFLVYQVSPAEVRLIAIRFTAAAAGAEDRNASRAALIGDCHVVYVQSIGGPAAAKVVRAGLHPMKVPEGGEAREVLAALQTVMAGSPPPWLAKAVGLPPEERVRFAVEGGS